MKYTTLGKTGLKVSVVGLGGIPVQRTDKAEAVEIVNACMEQGINYLDTARGYTISEEYFGEAIKGSRDKWIIATKSMARTYDAMKADIFTRFTTSKPMKNLKHALEKTVLTKHLLKQKKLVRLVILAQQLMAQKHLQD